jgi:hypothetical protein
MLQGRELQEAAPVPFIAPSVFSLALFVRMVCQCFTSISCCPVFFVLAGRIRAKPTAAASGLSVICAPDSRDRRLISGFSVSELFPFLS